MITFRDYYDNAVQLSFENQPFSEHPKHVWVICTFNGKWLLTIHKNRGIEFPGGKVEKGETPEEAAHREVMEETGASISNMFYIGQYRVDGKADTIIKNIYYAEIDKLYTRKDYFETEGPVILEELPENIKLNSEFSFMMKDQVLTESLKQIKRLSL
ncbi:RNA deprotection pyrophosphohydrolase [Bacillus sp. Marseille-P3661]|uniref:RNA deprotection pyrophosphohydrolase n=1 Tax=Bacillus sp. Marseille-P3661 TaxID=1936234 RepID=UPI000C859C0E|nr:nucleoside triphosphatase YtkD [Bacillus sp. Marseille-P3661]